MFECSESKIVMKIPVYYVYMYYVNSNVLVGEFDSLVNYFVNILGMFYYNCIVVSLSCF